QSIGADHLVIGALVDVRPKVAGGFSVTRVLCQGGRHYPHPWHSTGDLGALEEGLGSRAGIVQLLPLNEPDSIPHPPRFGILADALFHQLRCGPGIAGSFGRVLSEENGSKFVCRYEVRIECRRGLQQWFQQLVIRRVCVMMTPEVLYRSRPIEVG